MIFLVLLFIIECIAFCYMYFQILEIKKDIDTLYNNYSFMLQKSFEVKKNKRSVLK